MSDRGVRVLEDPGHPEGGHVLILFEGVSARPDDVRFQVESLEEGAQSWPEHPQEPVSVAVTERGLEIVAGPEIGNAILEGTPVAVTLPAADLHGEILWPNITPLVLGRPARGGMHAATRRRVVAVDASQKGSAAEQSETREQKPRPSQDESKARSSEQAVDVKPISGTVSAGKSEAKDAVPAPAGRRLALVAAVSFVAGVGSVLAYAAAGGPWPFRPPEPKPVAAAPAPPVPSLYDALILPSASPRGLRAEGKAAPDAFVQVKAAWGSGARPRDGAEAAYWLRAIVRDAMPENLARSFSALGYLALNGDGVQRDPALATLLLELAAIGGRCDAFAGLADGIEPPDTSRANRWRGIAEQKRCPSRGSAEPSRR